MIILFDLDDTLVDHQSAFRAGTRALHRYLSSTLSLEEFAQRWSAAHRRYYDRYLAGEISHDDQRRARTRDIAEGALPDDAADAIFGVYLEAYEAAWTLLPDVRPCL